MTTIESDRLHETLEGHARQIRALRKRVDSFATGDQINATSITGIIPPANAPVYWWYNGNLLGAGTKVDLRQNARVWISGSFVAGRAYYDIGTYPDPPWISGVSFSANGDLVCFGARIDLQQEWGVWISGSCVGDEITYQIGAYAQGGGGGASGTVAFYAYDVLFCEALALDLEGCDGIWISGSCVEGGSKARYQIGGGGGAPGDVEYVVAAADPTLTNEIVKEYMGDNIDPCVYPAAPNALDDEFEDGGVIDGKWIATNDPAGADALNQTAFPGYLHVGLLELGTDNFDNLVRLHQTPPAGAQAMTFIARVAVAVTGLAGEGGEFCGAYIYLGNSVNDEGVAAALETNYTANVYQAELVQGTPGVQINAGALTSMTTSIGQRANLPGRFMFIKLEKATANAYTSANTYNVYVSGDGLIWHQVATQSFTFTTACDEVGLFFRRPKSQTGTPKGEVLVDFFRRTV